MKPVDVDLSENSPDTKALRNIVEVDETMVDDRMNQFIEWIIKVRSWHWKHSIMCEQALMRLMSDEEFECVIRITMK